MLATDEKFGVSRIFVYCNQQECIKFIGSKDISLSNKFCSLGLPIHQRIVEKNATLFSLKYLAAQ